MTDSISLANLELIPYINKSGQLPEQFQAKVGVYAIFDADKTLQYIGYSRDIFLSLKQHLIRQPDRCYWVKAHTIEKPSRTILEDIKNAWILENGIAPIGNQSEESQWTQPISVQDLMNAEEQEKYSNFANTEVDRIKILKQVSRRIEAQILERLQARGLQMELRFNPKLKEEGLLDLK